MPFLGVRGDWDGGGKKKKTHTTPRDSQVVPHPSTKRAHLGLTSEFGTGSGVLPEVWSYARGIADRSYLNHNRRALGKANPGRTRTSKPGLPITCLTAEPTEPVVVKSQVAPTIPKFTQIWFGRGPEWSRQKTF